MIWIYPLSRDEGDDLGCLECLLSPVRRQQMMKYRFSKDRKLCLLAYVLLRTALLEEYGITDIPDIITPKRMKPFFADIPLHFNLSHCGSAVLCALDTSPVGVDIQDGDRALISIADSFMTEAEKAAAKGDIREIMRIWTLKEAYGKLSGMGICYAMHRTDFSCVENSTEWQTYCGKKVISTGGKDYAFSVFADNAMDVRTAEKSTLLNAAEKISKK